jgi:serine/threonine-protein kinase RsbW
MTPAPDPGASGASFACVVAADPFAVRAGLARMFAAPPLVDLTADHRGTAEVVLAEVLNNIAEHAYVGGMGEISVTLRQTGAGLHCLVTDDGVAMPGGTLPAGNHPAQRAGGAERPLQDLPLADLPEGGFGWHLIRRLTQDLRYARVGGQNRLTFVIRA